MNGTEGAIEMDAAEGSESPAGRIRHRNPIFDRELKTLLRSDKAFVLLGIYVGLSALFVLGSWPRDPGGILVAGAISRELFSLFGMGQTVLLLLLVPAAMAGSVTREKEGETLDLLLATPLSASQIILGKFFSGLAYLMLVIFASTPALMLCYLIGGLGWQDIAGLYVFLSAQAALYGMVSVACSVFLHRTHISIIISYLIAGFSAFVLSQIYGDGIGFLFSIRNLFVLGLVAFGVFLAYQSARARIRKPFNPVRKAMEEEDVEQQLGLIIRRDEFPDRMIAPPRRTEPMKDGVNPILDKELQAEVYGSGSLFVRLVIQFGMVLSLLVMIGCIVWVMTVGRTSEVTHPEYLYFCFLVAYVLIVAPSFATSTFTQEKEFHMMESLILTLIPRSKIVMGKFMAILRVVASLTLLNSICFFITVVLSSHNYMQVPALLLTVGTTMFISISVGMFMSLMCRTTTVSTLATYFVLFATLVGPVLLKVFLTRFFRDIPLSLLEVLDMFSPFLACFNNGPVENQFRSLGVHGILYGSISVFLLIWMSSRFERIVKRQAEQS